MQNIQDDEVIEKSANARETSSLSAKELTLPHFSVATPTRNALDKLRRCVGSVSGQSGVHVEHLIQDACSTDGTGEWLKSLRSVDGRTEPDAGMYDAISRAWARSNGLYLSWLNSDEQYLPGTLLRVKEAFEASPEIDVIYGQALIVDVDGRPLAIRIEPALRRHYVTNGFLYIYSCTMFFRRRLLERGMLRLDPSLRYAADMDMVLHLLKSGAKFHRLGDVLSVFGVDGANLSTHARAAEENELVAQKHGALPPPLRRLFTVTRQLERLMLGAYRRRDVSFNFALDEVPSYIELSATGIGGRYRLTS